LAGGAAGAFTSGAREFVDVVALPHELGNAGGFGNPATDGVSLARGCIAGGFISIFGALAVTVSVFAAVTGATGNGCFGTLVAAGEEGCTFGVLATCALPGAPALLCPSAANRTPQNPDTASVNSSSTYPLTLL
jgi:predicted phage tail protein